MKKYIITVGIMFFVSLPVFAQSWTVRNNLGETFGDFDFEYTIITKSQYERLLRQHTAMKEYATVDYTDILELKPQSGKLVKGSRPNFNGYYYILVKITALTDSGRRALNEFGGETRIIHGNSNTGRLTISFYKESFSSSNEYLLSSDDFVRIYRQFIGFVNGE
jgi:hypothetical protein